MAALIGIFRGMTLAFMCVVETDLHNKSKHKPLLLATLQSFKTVVHK